MGEETSGEEGCPNLVSGTKLGKAQLCKYMCANDHIFSASNGGDGVC